MTIGESAARYIAFCEGMTPEDLDRLDAYCAPDVRFRDPFNDATGVEAYRRVLSRMFEDVGQPRFAVKASALQGDHCLLRWRFAFRRAGGDEVAIEGMSEIRFTAEGLVQSHCDFWDAGRVYETVPLLRTLLRLVRRRLSAG